MNSDRDDRRRVDLKSLQEARPWLRTAMAFMLYTFTDTGLHHDVRRDDAYFDADWFLDKLEADIRRAARPEK